MATTELIGQDVSQSNGDGVNVINRQSATPGAHTTTENSISSTTPGELCTNDNNQTPKMNNLVQPTNSLTPEFCSQLLTNTNIDEDNYSEGEEYLDETEICS